MPLPSRLSGSLPLSMAIHFAAVVLLVVIPLTAEIVPPLLATNSPEFMRAMPVPPLPPPPTPRAAHARVIDPARAPHTVPDEIVPETPYETPSTGPVDPYGVPHEGAGVPG